MVIRDPLEQMRKTKAKMHYEGVEGFHSSRETTQLRCCQGKASSENSKLPAPVEELEEVVTG
jgi:hypothetical protein